MIKQNLRNDIFFLFLLFTLTYPLFYYVYKFSIPSIGIQDFYAYYKLFESFDFASTESPFNTRLLGPFLVFILNKTGLYYSSTIAFSEIQYAQSVYFNAILVNYIAIIFSCFFIWKITREICNDYFGSMSVVVFLLLSFGTMFFSIGGGTDGVSVLLIALSYYFYRKGSWWIVPVFVISIFQREFLFMLFFVLGAIDLWQSKKKDNYIITIMILCIAFFAIYLGLRKTIFYTERWSYQLSGIEYLKSFSVFKFKLDFLMQVIVSQNILLFYFLLVWFKWINNIPFHQKSLVKILILSVFAFLVVVISRLDTSGGRLFYMFYPILIPILFSEFYKLKEYSPENEVNN